MVTRLKNLLFANNSIKQTIAKNIFWLSISHIGSRLIRAVIIIYAARILGAAEYGVFSYALSLAGFFTVFSDIGINQLITRELAKYPEKKFHYFSTAFWIKISLFIFVTILIITISPYFSKIKEVVVLVPFIALIVIFDGIREFSLTSIRAKEKMEFEALTMVATNFAITAFGFAAIYLSPTSKYLIFSYAAATALGALVSIFIIKEEFKKIFTHFDKKLIKPMISSAWPMALNSIIGAFMLNTDVLMLGWWRSAKEIGYYSASQRIIQVFYSLPAIIASAIFPAISRLIGEKDEIKIKLLMEKGLTIVFLIAIPLVVGGIILGKPIINLVYGKEYLPAAIVFQMLIITNLIIFPATLISNTLLAYNKQKAMVLNILIGGIGNIIFNSILIPRWGMIGSSIATIIAQSINYWLSLIILKKANNFHIIRHLKKIIISAVIMGLVSLILNNFGINIILNIIISGSVYFITLYILKEKILSEIIGLAKKI